MPGLPNHLQSLNTPRGLRQTSTSTSESQREVLHRTRERIATSQNEGSFSNICTLPLRQHITTQTRNKAPSRTMDEYDGLGMDIPSKRDDETEEEYSRRVTEVLLSEWTVGGTSEDEEHRGRGRSRETGREARMDSPGLQRQDETQEEYANRVIGSLSSELRGWLPPSSPPTREPKPEDDAKPQGSSSSSCSTPSYTQASQELEQYPRGRVERPPNCNPANFSPVPGPGPVDPAKIDPSASLTQLHPRDEASKREERIEASERWSRLNRMSKSRVAEKAERDRKERMRPRKFINRRELLLGRKVSLKIACKIAL